MSAPAADVASAGAEEAPVSMLAERRELTDWLSVAWAQADVPVHHRCTFGSVHRSVSALHTVLDVLRLNDIDADNPLLTPAQRAGLLDAAAVLVDGALVRLEHARDRKP